MRLAHPLTVIVGLGCLYLACVGFLAGVCVERIRFDAHRTAVLTQLGATNQRLHARLMDLERRTDVRPSEGTER
jgi:hypothetical protein